MITKIIWLDSEKKYLPVKYIEERSGKVVRSIDYKFKEEKAGEWITEAWKDDFTQDTLFYSAKVEAKSLSINQNLPDSLFDIDIPVGTLVHDYTLGKKYIKRENDERPVLPGELKGNFAGSNFTDVMNSEPAYIQSRSFLYPYGFGLFVLLAVIAFLVMWKKKGNKHLT